MLLGILQFSLMATSHLAFLIQSVPTLLFCRYNSKFFEQKTKQKVIGQMSTAQDSPNNFKPNLTCIFLSLRAN